MKVNIIFLDYQRHDFTKQVKEHNFRNSGHDFDVVEIDMKGISAAINKGIQLSKGYDAFVTMANDILMQDNWLKGMVTAATAIPMTGMCGIHCVEKIGDYEEINGVFIHRTFTAFGNVLIPMQCVNEIGYFNTDYDPYGMQDGDYAYRLNAVGRINYYLHGYKSEHIGHDVGNGSEYRAMKDEGLKQAVDKWGKWTKRYEETNDYSINIPEWPKDE